MEDPGTLDSFIPTISADRPTNRPVHFTKTKCLYMKKIFPRIFPLAVVLLLSLLSSAQTTRTLSGTVTNDKGEPLSRASITIKGSSRGTTTNDRGEFTSVAEIEAN